ncbi:MAG: hypothetical protein MUC97_14090 [Bernardetiaceae bacterium]|jgi:hypothetical protein|nr:hypothetical protein [Bernardetiaceae bacterium]
MKSLKLMKSVLWAALVWASPLTALANEGDEPCPCLSEAAGKQPLFCDIKKCTVERGKTTYFFEIAKRGGNKYDLLVKAVVGGNANVVFSSFVTVTDNRSGAGGEFEVKILHAINEGYRWTPSGGDFLKGIYDNRTGRMRYETGGRMGNFADSQHGYTEAELNKGLTPPKFDIGYVIKSTVAYFILQYPGAMPLK